MVENKKTKRERDIKSKLMAAIAMLLVSSIMMVSTTYAWFTLSTAPEVTGITTNIAANGNLEIALSPESGMGADVGNATTGMSLLTEKNLTWGNLVDMSDVSYNLGGLTLAPAQLYVNVDAEGNKSLGDNVLATPEYGADGRISGLKGNAFIASKVGADKYAQPATGESHVFGVRAVGTTSGLSPQASLLRSARSTMTAEIAAAISAASQSLTETGGSLAEMMVTHATVTAGQTENYEAYTGDLETLITKLDASVTNIDNALMAYLSAAITLIEDENQFKAASTWLSGKNITTVGIIDGKVTIQIGTTENPDTYTVTLPTEFTTAYNARNTIKTNISNAQTKLNEFKNGSDKSWSGVSPVLNCLLNTSSVDDEGNPLAVVKINGKTMDEIKGMDDNTLMPFAVNMLKEANIELYEGSGLYYELAQITGNITAVLKNVFIPEISKGGLNLYDVEMEKVVIKTMVPASEPSYLPTLRTQTNSITPAAGTAAAEVDTNYGYIIDLMVRTNAADTQLMLQTEAAQRVYGESTSEMTAGKGTSFTFKTYDLNQVPTLEKLLTSIRVAFFDPSQGANKILGLARVVATPVTSSVVVGSETVLAEDGTESVVDVTEYTITGYLELCEIKSNITSTTTAEDGSTVVIHNDLTATGVAIADAAKEDDDATVNYAENDVLCDLTQNVPQAISAMVYLDGENVTSADVLADGSITGALNLQFRSSAALEPMENSDLMTMASYGVTRGVGIVGADRVLELVPYNFSVAAGHKLDKVTITAKNATTPTELVLGTDFTFNENNSTYTIDASKINGDIVITTVGEISLKTKTSVTGNDAVTIKSSMYRVDGNKVEIELNGYADGMGTVTVAIGGGAAEAVVPVKGVITAEVPDGIEVTKDTTVVVTITAPATGG